MTLRGFLRVSRGVRFHSMVAFTPTSGRVLVSTAVAAVFFASLAPNTALAQILPWEIVVAQIETGRLRFFAERLAKQNVLYQLHLGETNKSEMVETANQIDRILESLEQGSPTYSVPAPWTEAIREQVNRVDEAWGPLRSVATASPYDYFNVRRQFEIPDRQGADPLLLRYFDDTMLNLIAESEKLIELYFEACVESGLEVCSIAKATGINAMLIERATRQAVYLVVGINNNQNRKGIAASLEAYRARQRANEKSPFFAAALDPERSISAAAGAKLLLDLRGDWDALSKEFAILASGDEENFDLRRMLESQSRLVDKVERLTAALIRYASLVYGA
jgi:hypothetical protein